MLGAVGVGVGGWDHTHLNVVETARGMVENLVLKAMPWRNKEADLLRDVVDPVGGRDPIAALAEVPDEVLLAEILVLAAEGAQ